MKVEVVQFYPLDRPNKHGGIGTLHVIIVDLNIELRGIEVVLRDNKLLFFTPSITCFDKSSNKKVRYGIFTFVEDSKKKALINAIRKEGEKYVMANHKLPLAFAQNAC